jgi:hypothetical protein
MLCQTGIPESRPGRTILTRTLYRTCTRDSPFILPDPEDLKGLREWVTAKRICEEAHERRHGRIYIAPWRVG